MTASAIQVILDNPRNYVIKVTVSAAEAGTVLADPSALDPVCTRLRLKKIDYNVAAATTVTLNWDATTPLACLTLNSALEGTFDFCDIGGLPNNAGTGITGKLLMTTVGTGAVTMVLYLLKTNPVP